MAWLNELPGMGAAEDRAAKAMSFPVGLASPLWLAFGAAASAGVAFWLATRWTRPANLEAMLSPPRRALEPPVVIELTPEPEPEAALEVAIEVAPEPVLEAVAEIAPEPTPEPVVAEAAPELKPEPAPAPVATPLTPDDLTLIVGIGPKLAAALAERGVTRFSQLAAWGAQDLADVDNALNLKGRAVRDAWVAQARRFAAS